MALSGHVLIDPARLPRDTGPELMWAPSLRNSLRVSPEALELAEREAERRWDRCAQVLKNRLLRVELDGIMRDHLARAEEIRQDLLELGPESLEKIIADLKAKSPGGNFMILTSGNKEARQSIAPLNRQAAYPPGTFADNKIYNLFVGAGLLPTTAALNVPGAAGRDRDLVYRIANQIFGEDVPPFSSHQWNLRVGLAALEALMLVYTLCETANLAEAATRRLHLSSLLPQAMQRRKPAVASAGMPESSGWRPLPASREELLELGPESLEKIIADLKAKSPGGNFMILTSGNKEARQSIAPLNRQAAYPPGTFADNKIYNLFVGAGLLPTTAALNVPGAAGRDRDLVYRIANQIFGEDVPPFSSHQWNLRVGLAALEALMLVYTLCETANLAEAATRRLHLSSLLPQAMQRRKPAMASAGMPGAYPVQTLFRHGELFRFIWAHYVRPTVAADPQASISSLFPGLVLLALELKLMDGQAPSHYAINLTGPASGSTTGRSHPRRRIDAPGSPAPQAWARAAPGQHRRRPRRLDAAVCAPPAWQPGREIKASG